MKVIASILLIENSIETSRKRVIVNSVLNMETDDNHTYYVIWQDILTIGRTTSINNILTIMRRITVIVW